MLLFKLEEMAFMKKNKVIAIIGVFFSAVALIASAVELWYCIVHANSSGCSYVNCTGC